MTKTQWKQTGILVKVGPCKQNDSTASCMRMKWHKCTEHIYPSNLGAINCSRITNHLDEPTECWMQWKAWVVTLHT